MSDPVLVVNGVRKQFPGVVALDDVSLTVAPGEVHALVGENGAGKSTLVRIIGGLHNRDSGEFLMDGEPVDFHSTAGAKDAGMSGDTQRRRLQRLRIG